MSRPRDESPSTQTTLLLHLREEGMAREVAWNEFYRIYAPIISGFARRMGARRNEIEDVVQEVMLGFYSAVPEFRYDRRKGRFRGYLKTCVWRKLEKCLAQRMQTMDTTPASAVAIDGEIDKAWEQAWQQARLAQAMEMVRGRYTRRVDQRKTWEAFEHYVLLDRPAEEVACALSMKVEQVHQAKSRMERALRETMDDLEAFAD
jgi:RNA polymerase sigma-70 factor, ECF subfamily